MRQMSTCRVLVLLQGLACCPSNSIAPFGQKMYLLTQKQVISVFGKQKIDQQFAQRSLVQ